MADAIYAGDGGYFKVCAGCHNAKPLPCYSPQATGALGRKSKCKECRADEARRNGAALGAKPIGGTMKCERCGAECVRTSGFRKYCEPCSYLVQRENANAANARYGARRTTPRKRDTEKLRASQRRHKERNPDAVRERYTRYNEAHRDEINRKARERNKTPERKAYMAEWDAQYRSLPKSRLDQRMKTAIKIALKGNKAGRSWESLVGYTLEDLRIHLERQFLPGMSWDNFGNWHIDHIVPKASYRYDNDNDPDFRACWALTNLRPLWAEENLSKGSKRLHLL